MNKIRTTLSLIGLALLVLLSTACDPNQPLGPLGPQINQPTRANSARPTMPVIIFCGIHPDDPKAQAKANILARQAGADVSMGGCMPPDWANYTTANPGKRYMTRDQYLRATVINANAGMKTIVYEPGIWSDDEAVRNEAIEFWRPHAAWLFAFDMGDEFDPTYAADWDALVHRFDVIDTFVSPAIGIGGFTNHMSYDWVLDRALADIPAQSVLMSYDVYGRTNGVPQESLDTAARYAGRTNNLVCAVNALTHAHYKPNAREIKLDMQLHRDAGCDFILIFGGVAPYLDDLSPDPVFGGNSLVTWNGKATSWAKAVLDGAK